MIRLVAEDQGILIRHSRLRGLLPNPQWAPVHLSQQERLFVLFHFCRDDAPLVAVKNSRAKDADIVSLLDPNGLPVDKPRRTEMDMNGITSGPFEQMQMHPPPFAVGHHLERTAA